MNIPDPYVRITYKKGTSECIPALGGLRDKLYDVAMYLWLRQRPMPEGWKALGVPYRPSPDIELKIITDFSEHEHEGKIGIRFKAEGTVARQEVDVTFSISKRQLEDEEKADEAFGGGARGQIGIRLA